MKIIEEYNFRDIVVLRLGFSFVGKPYMNVYCYIVNGIMIDTGQAHIGNDLLKLLEKHRLEKIILTHHHEDHSGNAFKINYKFGTPVYGSMKTVEKMKKPYKILPYQHFMFGSTTPLDMKMVPKILDGENVTLKSIPTPGHAKDHTVYYDGQRGILFSGDLFIGDKIRYFRVDEDIDQTISSLKRVLENDFDVVLCGHRPLYKNGRDQMERKLDYLLNFRGEVENLHFKGYSEREILKHLAIGEVHKIKLITFGNVSLLNMVRSTVKSINMEREI